jgi:hypothetical protein
MSKRKIDPFPDPVITPVKRLKYEIVRFGLDNGRKEMKLADKIFRNVKELREA